MRIVICIMKTFIAHKLDNYNLAIECYKKSAERILDNYSIFYNWGNAILSWAQIKNDENCLPLAVKNTRERQK